MCTRDTKVLPLLFQYFRPMFHREPSKQEKNYTNSNPPPKNTLIEINKVANPFTIVCRTRRNSPGNFYQLQHVILLAKQTAWLNLIQAVICLDLARSFFPYILLSILVCPRHWHSSVQLCVHTKEFKLKHSFVLDFTQPNGILGDQPTQ